MITAPGEERAILCKNWQLAHHEFAANGRCLVFANAKHADRLSLLKPSDEHLPYYQSDVEAQLDDPNLN